MNELSAAKREMIEAGGRTAHTFGLNRLFGRLYMLLYLSSNILSLDEIAEQLGVSKASVSIACRQLESWGALERVWKQGDRRDYYRAQTDLSKLLREGFLVSINKKLESAHSQIERSIELLEEENGKDEEATAFLRSRLREAEDYRARISRLLNNPLTRRML
ncbi:MAG: MarR family transcriptional regulator [Verrucomicrobia bacterium]|nr:MarR family transcriptional regulator [Verrucomicrobiota bacterium]